MKILFISYIDFKPTQYGASLRPQKMYDAFLKEGHEVKLLCGGQETFKRKKRLSSVREINHWLDTERPDICYVESPVYPVLWHFDRALIRRVHRMGIPVGYYYRDCHDRFPSVFPRKKGFVNWLKSLWLNLQLHNTLSMLKAADIVFFPTEEMKQLFSFRDMRILPPGGDDHLDESCPEDHSCIYVGGIVQHYDGELLLRAFQLLNDGEERYPLTLICREREWEMIPSELKNGGWLEVRHLSGEAIAPYLKRAALGLVIGTENHPYNQIAVSVKLYEYAGYGLPVVYLRNTPMDRIVGTSQIGVGANATPEALAAAVRKVFLSEETYSRYRKNTEEFLRRGNTWNHRAIKIVSELSEKNK